MKLCEYTSRPNPNRAEGNYEYFIGFQSALDLGLVQVLNTINRVTDPLEEYQGIFEGIGKLRTRHLNYI